MSLPKITFSLVRTGTYRNAETGVEIVAGSVRRSYSVYRPDRGRTRTDVGIRPTLAEARIRATAEVVKMRAVIAEAYEEARAEVAAAADALSLLDRGFAGLGQKRAWLLRVAQAMTSDGALTAGRARWQLIDADHAEALAENMRRAEDRLVAALIAKPQPVVAPQLHAEALADAARGAAQVLDGMRETVHRVLRGRAVDPHEDAGLSAYDRGVRDALVRAHEAADGSARAVGIVKQVAAEFGVEL